jgi:hypothetical protein
MISTKFNKFRLAQFEILVHPALSVAEMTELKSYMRGLLRERPLYFDAQVSFTYHSSVVTIRRKRICSLSKSKLMVS